MLILILIMTASALACQPNTRLGVATAGNELRIGTEWPGKQKPAWSASWRRRVSGREPCYGLLVDVVVLVDEPLGALLVLVELDPLGTGTVVVLFVVVLVEVEGVGAGTIVVLLLGGLFTVVCEIVVGVAVVLLSYTTTPITIAAMTTIKTITIVPQATPAAVSSGGTVLISNILLYALSD